MKNHLALLLILIIIINNKIKTSDNEETTRQVTLPNKSQLFIATCCPICLEGRDMLTTSKSTILRCGHHLHTKCLKTWTKTSKKSTCPSCRQEYTKDKWGKDNRTIIKFHLKELARILRKKQKSKKASMLAKLSEKVSSEKEAIS